MICKILVFIIIAISYLPILAAKNSTVLDINNFKVLQKPGEPPPKNYSIIKFISSSTSKATSVVYGPIQIWEGISTGRKVESVDLEIIYGLPQLVTVQSSSGSVSENHYYKWEKGRFIPESHANYLSYQTIVKEEDTLLDYTVYLDIKKGPNYYAFDRSKKEINGFHFDVFKPKSYFNLVGIIYETTLVYGHEEIESVEVLTVSSGPRLLLVKIPNIQEPKRFIYVEKWEECDEARAQQFLQQLSTGTPIPGQAKEPQTSPAKPGEPLYTTLEPGLPVPEIFTQDQISALNLVKQCPVTTPEFIPATSPNPKLVVFDLNAANPDFVQKTDLYGSFSVTTVTPKEGYNVSELIETGMPIWTNTRSSQVLEIIAYERNDLLLLLILKTNRSGEKIEYYYRYQGRFSSCKEFEFKQLFIEWKHTDKYDKTFSYSLYGANNPHLFKEINRLVDGVHFKTIHPTENFDFMRIVNGSEHLIRNYDEKWYTFTITYFNSTHKLLSLNIHKNGQKLVRYFKCIGTFVEVDSKTHLSLFQQYKSLIHVQSDILFDLSKKNAAHTTVIEHSTELSPLSGFHVKMVTFWDFVIWRSHETRCTSVLVTTPERVGLVKLNLNSNDNLSQEYYRIFEKNVFRIQTFEEYEFLKKKVGENLKNPNSEMELANLSFDIAKQYNLMVFDASTSNKSVVTFTHMSSLLPSTTYGPIDGYVFGEIRYGSRVLWKTHSIDYFCTKFIIYFFKGEPRLGLLYMVNNKQPAVEYFYYGGNNPVSLDKSTFENRHNELINALNMTQIQSASFKAVLDLLKFDNYNANGMRKNGLFSVEYTHKENLPIQMIVFGYEILWMAKGEEGATKVVVFYYEMQPMVFELTMNDSNKTVKYFSHFHKLWRKIDPVVVDNELNNIASLEPQRRGFTLPDLHETTEYDVGSSKDEYFTTKKFLSKEGLLTTILDGRNRLHKPDTLSFVESLMLHYHGSNPTLLSFREKNVFGYYFDYHYIYSNGWRLIPFAKFEQLFNFYRTKPPKDLCSKNQFVFDILQPDFRVSATRLPKHHFGFRFTITNDQYTFCSVKAGDKVIWTAPKNKYLKTFNVYYEGSIPLLTKFIEEDAAKQKEDIYIQLEGQDWTEVDQSVFENAINILTQRYYSNNFSVPSPPSYIPEEQPPSPPTQPTPPIAPVQPLPQDFGIQPMEGPQAIGLPTSIFETPSVTQPTLKDVIMITPPTGESFISPTKKATPSVTPTTQPGSITASSLPSQTSKKTPKPTQLPPTFPSQVPKSPPPSTRTSPKKPGQVPVLPEGSVTLDILGPEDKTKFRYGSGHCDKVVPFREFKSRTGFNIRMVSCGDKVAWHTESPSYKCTALKVFFRDNTPILMEFLIRDDIKGTNKYLFSFFDENKWVDCDQDMFDATLDSLIAFYLEKSSQS